MGDVELEYTDMGHLDGKTTEELKAMAEQWRNAAKIALSRMEFRVANNLAWEAREIQKEIERREHEGTVQSAGE